MKPRIGDKVGDYESKCVILQSCNKLPAHYNRESEEGPFFGLSCEGSYTWYSESQMIEKIKEYE